VRGRLTWAVLGAGLLSSAGAWGAETGGFTLETGSPDALCPELEVTRELVARRLGSLVAEGRKGWRARYTIGHAPSGTPRDFVRLELFSPEGTVELLRDLPIEGDSCRTMAEVIALVLDRYFRGLGADGPRPPEPAPPAPLPAAPVPPTAALRSEEPRTLLARRLSAEFAVTSPGAQPWLGLRASTVLGSRFELALGVRLALTPLHEATPRGASVEARALTVRSSLAWRLALPPGILRLGPTVSLTGEHATTFGLANQRDRTRARWSAGLEAGFIVPLGRALFVEGAISADLLVSSGRFFIEEREVLSPRWLTVGGSLGLGYAWSK
jgi:hypothetical protein